MNNTGSIKRISQNGSRFDKKRAEKKVTWTKQNYHRAIFLPNSEPKLNIKNGSFWCFLINQKTTRTTGLLDRKVILNEASDTA